MERIILVRYGEIFLKGLNRPQFEKLLLKAIKRALKRHASARVEKGLGRYYVFSSESDFNGVADALVRVFGIHSISPAIEVKKDIDSIKEAAKELVNKRLDGASATFKVDTKRADKRFPGNSMEISADIGGYLIENCKGLTVDVRNPSFIVHVEIRESAYVYVDVIKGQGGMPICSNGRAALLLSGGIDSPVAGHMVAKRGVGIEAVHFFSPPYTGEKAKQKVIELCGVLAKYTGHIRLNIVNFTNIQTAIYEKCPNELLVIIMRRFMMRIAVETAKISGAQAIVTGESIGQVASQTMESIVCTNDGTDMPILRPLIGMDKEEIIERAQNIGTFDISIRPFEDCCTVFVPKHPATKPTLDKVLKAEEALDIEALVKEAFSSIEVVNLEG